MIERNNIRTEPRSATATGGRGGAARLRDILLRPSLAALGLLLVSAGSVHAQTVTLYDLRNNLPGVQPANLRVSATEDLVTGTDSSVAINFEGDGRPINYLELVYVSRSANGTPNAWLPSGMDFLVTQRPSGTVSFAASPLRAVNPGEWQAIFGTPSNADWTTPVYTSSGYNVYRALFIMQEMTTVAGQEHSITWHGFCNISGVGQVALLFSDNSLGSFGASNDWRWVNGAGLPRSLASVGAPFPTVAARIGYLPCPVITTQPLPASTCSQGTARLSVAITPDDAARPGLYTYQWQWQPAGVGTAWVNLATGDNAEAGGVPVVHAANVNTATLEARPLAGYINFAPRAFRCIVTNLCGSVTSDTATLTICPADFNCDGAVDGDDVIAFFGPWDGGELAADVTGDGSVDGDDVIAFFNGWDSGC